jgi:hypothetical protein
MAATLVRLVTSALKPAQWLYQLFVDQTQIEFIAPEAPKCQKTHLPIHDNGTGEGLLWFGITTRSKHQVAITGVEVDYAAPLQILDPGQRGFFTASGSQDAVFPFRLSWRGTALVRRDIQQAFAILVRFTGDVRERLVRITTYARR